MRTEVHDAEAREQQRRSDPEEAQRDRERRRSREFESMREVTAVPLPRRSSELHAQTSDARVFASDHTATSPAAP